jgi:hypothetical protein
VEDGEEERGGDEGVMSQMQLICSGNSLLCTDFEKDVTHYAPFNADDSVDHGNMA